MTTIAVRVTPRASANAVTGCREGTWLVRVTAPPVDAAANTAVVELLATSLHVPKRAVRIVRGAASRSKVVSVDGLDAAEIQRRLSAILA